jgi:hypothetical protein
LLSVTGLVPKIFVSAPATRIITGDVRIPTQTATPPLILNQEETMKMPFILTLAGLAIGFALPGLAQEQDTVAPEVRQQIEAVTARREEAYNKYDAAAWAAFYTQDAIDVWSWLSEGGAAVGLPAILKSYESEFASYPAKQSFKVLQVYAIGNEVCAVTEFMHYHMYGKGHTVVVYVHGAEDWKVRLSYSN